jgi:hypothetical protein
MKKIIVFVLSLIALVSISGIGFEAAQPTFNVDVSSMLDSNNSNLDSTLTAKAYGSKVQLDGNLAVNTNYSFAFWIVNGTVRHDLAIDHSFVVTGEMDIQAVFSNASEHAAIFMDTNGKIIDTQYVLNGSGAQDPTQSIQTASDIFFSEYIEGSSYNKAIEIYNGTGADVDLTDYTVEVYSNGSQTANNTETFDGAGILANGETYVLRNSSADSGISSVSDSDSSIANFNGDDALTLSKNGIVIDMFGVTGEDPGSEWTVGNGSTKEHTLVRNPDVFSPADSWDPNEWTVYEQDDFSYLGSHSVSYTTAMPDKVGYVVNPSTPWDHSLSNMSDDQVFTLQYTKDTNTTQTLTVNNETGTESTDFDYNTLVNISADPASSGEFFSHWETGGEIVSFNETYRLTLLEDREITAVYQATPETRLPVITMSNDLALRTGYESYLVQFDHSEDYDLIDYGLLTSNENRSIELHEPGVTKYTGSSFIDSSNEFLMSLKLSGETVRGYLVLEDSQGDQTHYYTLYTDTLSPSILGVTDDTIELGQTYNPLSGVSAEDNIEGDVTDDIIYTVEDSTGNEVSSPGDFSGLSVGSYTITYSVTDTSGNEATKASTLSIATYPVETFIETFTNLELTASSYAAGSYSGDNSITWNYTESRGDYTLDGKAIMLDKDGDNSSLYATIDGGISSFSVDYYDAFNGAAEVELYINDTLIATSTSLNDGDGSNYGTFEVTGIDVSGQFTLKILAADSQMVLDNLTWTTYSNPQ